MSVKAKLLFSLILVLAFFLRFFLLGRNPPSLYWDEASLGYNAYSILTTGRDEHGEVMPLARFIAYGDYKPPGYIYSTVLSIFIFGLTEFAVRFPSAISGLMLVFVVFFLVRRLFYKEKIALFAAFFTAISPWAVHFSRGAFEANLAAFFNLLAIFLFMKSLEKKYYIVFSVISFILAFYTFNANRIISPLILIALFMIFKREQRYNLKWILIALVTGLIMVLPSINYLRSRESRLRFQEVSIFTSLSQVELANDRIKTDGNNIIANIVHNRRVNFMLDFLKHYTDNFSLRFLFTHGDVNPRLNVQTMGQLLIFDLPFLLFGFYVLLKKRDRQTWLIFSWMVVSAIPAGTARETPHALRILSILPSYQIISALGIYKIWNYVMNKKLYLNSVLLSIVCILLSVNLFYYLHDYYIHYPYIWSREWQYGYKEMVKYVNNIQANYDHIFVTKELGRPYIYFAFHTPLSQEYFAKNSIATRDWYGFWDVESIGKISFNPGNMDKIMGRIIFVTTDNIPQGFRLLHEVNDLSGNSVFKIAEKI